MVVEDTNADVLPDHKILCSGSSLLGSLKLGQKYKGRTGEVQEVVF